MNINQLVDFARAYARMGSSVQEQLDSFVSGERDDLNVNAMDMCADLLKECGGLDDVEGSYDLIDELDSFVQENS